MLTGLTALALEAEGRLDLRRDVNGYLGSFQVPAAFGTPVTMSDLLTHTGGFDERGVGVSARGPKEVVPLADFVRGQLPPRVRKSGTVTAYSNHGYALAGLVLQEATGRPFAELVAQTVLTPLGMSSSSFAQPLPETLEQRRAAGYMWRGRLVRVPRIYGNDAPASAWHATTADVVRLAQALLDSGEMRGVLSAAVRDALFRRPFRNHPSMTAVMPGGLRQDNKYTVGLLRHGGDWQDHANELVIVPERKLVIFVAHNNGEADDFGREVADLVLKSLGIQVRPPDAVQTSGLIPATLSGAYRTTRHARHGIEKLGLLTGRLPEYQVAVIAPETALINGRRATAGDGDVLMREDGELWAFRKDANGRPSYLFRAAAPMGAYERVSWWETVSVQRVALAALALTFLLITFGAIIRLIVEFVRRRKPGYPRSSLRHCVALLLLGATVASVVIGVGVVMSSIDPWELQYGLPTTVRAVLVLPWLYVAVLLNYFVVILSAPPARPFARFGVAALLIAGVTYASLLYHWNVVILPV